MGRRHSVTRTRHASFKLAKEGEEIGIYSAELLVIDSLSFGDQREDVSTGRKSDGAAEILFLTSRHTGPVKQHYLFGGGGCR